MIPYKNNSVKRNLFLSIENILFPWRSSTELSDKDRPFMTGPEPALRRKIHHRALTGGTTRIADLISPQA
jgi:hypothetical protein